MNHILADTCESELGSVQSQAPPKSVVFMQYTSAMAAPAADEAVICEDKDGATRWRQGADQYAFQLVDLMDRDPEHWQPTDLTSESCLQHSFDLFSWCSTCSSLPKYTVKKWFSKRAGLPYIYGTKKAKCYSSGRKNCTREKHSCMRKVVSWFFHPAKSWLRRIGRATMAMCRLLRPGFTIGSLKTAASDLLARCERLPVPKYPA